MYGFAGLKIFLGGQTDEKLRTEKNDIETCSSQWRIAQEAVEHRKMQVPHTVKPRRQR